MSENIFYQIADTRELLLQSYQLVYSRYQEKGFCSQNNSHMYFGLHDLLPETRTFVATDNGKVIATISVIPDGSMCIPSDHLFKNELNEYRQKNVKMVELSRFAVSPQYQHLSIVIFHYLFQLLYHSYIKSTDISDCIIMVEPKNSRLYRKLGFVAFSDVRYDEEASNAPSQLMLLKIREKKQLLPNLMLGTTPENLKGFKTLLTETLQKQKELAKFSQKIAKQNNSFSKSEYRLLNFKNYLLKSYLFQYHSKSKSIGNLLSGFESIQSFYRLVIGKQISAYNEFRNEKAEEGNLSKVS